MTTQPAPRPVDEWPARLVTDLWRQWVDPLAAAFDDLAVEDELDALRHQRDEPSASGPRQPDHG